LRLFVALEKTWQRFLCGGRLIFGPDASSIVLTLALIMTPLALFVGFVSFRLAEVIGPPLGLAVPVTAIAVGVFVSPCAYLIIHLY
jgi:palmitoyltransferase ZDHHC9/14/18